MAKVNGITLKFVPEEIGRGQWGDKFWLSTFRFPLKTAQDFEKVCASLGLTMSSCLNQLVTTLVKTTGVPKNVKAVKTAQATVWGGEAKPKAKTAPKAKAKVKFAPKAKVKRAVVVKAKPVVAKAKKAEPKKPATANLLERLKALKKSKARDEAA